MKNNLAQLNKNINIKKPLNILETFLSRGGYPNIPLLHFYIPPHKIYILKIFLPRTNRKVRRTIASETYEFVGRLLKEEYVKSKILQRLWNTKMQTVEYKNVKPCKQIK